MVRLIFLMLVMHHVAFPGAMAAAPDFPTAEWKLVEYVEKLNDRKSVCEADKMVDVRVNALGEEGIVSCIQQGGLPIRQGDQGAVFATNLAIGQVGGWAFKFSVAAGFLYVAAVGVVIVAGVRYLCHRWNGTEKQLKFMANLKTALAPKVAAFGCNRP